MLRSGKSRNANVVWLLLLLTACTRENASPPLHDIPQWTVSDKPLVEIGANEQDANQALARVASAIRLSNGQIVVASGTAPMLRWFDERGRFIRGTGRPGGGPGEFSGEGGFIVALWRLPDDSVATYDLLQRRLQVFDSTGRFARAVTLEPGVGNRGFDVPAMVGRFASGELLTSANALTNASSGELIRDSLNFVRWTSDGKRVGALLRLPGFTRFAPAYWQPRITVARSDGAPPPPPPPPPFAPRPVMWVSGDRFYYGSGDRYEIRVYDQAGSPLNTIEANLPWRALRPEMVAAARRDLEARSPVGPFRDAYLRLIEEAPQPDSLPPYDRLLVDDASNLWIRDFLVPGEPLAHWNVFTPDGKWIARVELPGSFEVRDIGSDYVLGLASDSLDVELVRVYKLSRSSK